MGACGAALKGGSTARHGQDGHATSNVARCVPPVIVASIADRRFGCRATPAHLRRRARGGRTETLTL